MWEVFGDTVMYVARFTYTKVPIHTVYLFGSGNIHETLTKYLQFMNMF